MAKFRTSPDDWRAIVDEAGSVVADVRVPGHEGGRWYAELLAAAPEMYELLQTRKAGDMQWHAEARALLARIDEESNE